MGRRLSFLSMLLVLLVCTVSSGALAGVDYSGALTSFSTPAGLVTSGLWSSEGFDVIGWHVNQNLDGSWHYVYGRVTSVLNTTHFIIELPTTFTAADILNPTGAFSTFAVGTFSPSPVLPFLPSAIYGADFLILPGQDTRVAFDANIGPDFGNFYAQGSPTESSYNQGFTTPNTNHDPTCGSVDNKILVPNPLAGAVPDASTIVLVCFGALQLLAVKNKIFR